MIKIRNILLLAVMIFASSCSDEDLDLVEEQQEDIVSFLTTSHSPTLISQSDLAESLEDDPEFYTTAGSTAYRYIVDYYSQERQERREVVNGDELLLTFWCYDFSGYSTPDDSDLYYTNDPLYESALSEAGLNVEYWDFSPKRIVLGQGDILKGIELSLLGCREGDSVEIYLTYNMAYGSNWVGVTNLESPVAFFCTIDSIEN
ncbi:MAG: FKBP-type peptidyl-prolyl cis-trans isomerase [Rikenellaceae bacterium]